MIALFLAEATNPLQIRHGVSPPGRPFHVAAARLLDRGRDVIILRTMALRRKNVLPLVIESEIERLVARRKSRAAGADRAG